MSTTQQLVLEALLLRIRYSPHELEAAANALRSYGEGEVANVLGVLSSLPLNSSPRKEARKPSPGPLTKAVAALEEKEPERYGSLSRFELRLRSKELLPDLDALRQLLASLGLKKATQGRREVLIKEIMGALVAMPWEDAKHKMNSILGRGTKPSTSYKELANYILQPEPKDRE